MADRRSKAVEPGWLFDPSRRHQRRYWDGERWTEHVETNGDQTTDPPDGLPPPGTRPLDRRGRRLRVAIVVGVLLLAALLIWANERPGDLEAAVCSDLRNGLSMFQIARGGLESGMSERRIAATMYSAIQDHCPEFEDDFKKTLIYQDWLL